MCPVARAHRRSVLERAEATRPGARAKSGRSGVIDDGDGTATTEPGSAVRGVGSRRVRGPDRSTQRTTQVLDCIRFLGISGAHPPSPRGQTCADMPETERSPTPRQPARSDTTTAASPSASRSPMRTLLASTPFVASNSPSFSARVAVRGPNSGVSAENKKKTKRPATVWTIEAGKIKDLRGQMGRNPTDRTAQEATSPPIGISGAGRAGNGTDYATTERIGAPAARSSSSASVGSWSPLQSTSPQPR